MARRPALDIVRIFTGSLMWAPDEYLDALTLLLAVSHVMDIFETVPYVLVTSRDSRVGKSTMSKNIPLLLADRPWRVNVNTTVESLRNKFLDELPPRSILMDDASKFYGEAGTARKTSSLYQMSVDGYEKNASFSVSRNGVSRDLPAFIMLWMNGLNNAVPGDLATRAVHFRLRPKPAHIRMRSALSIGVAKEAEPLKEELHRWASENRKVMQRYLQAQVFRVHPLLTDRVLQLWGPVFAVAHAAGGSWPQRCMDAFLAMALDEGGKPVLQRDEEALLDTAKVIRRNGDNPRLFAADLVPALRALPSDFYGEVDDEYLVTDLLPRALGDPARMRGRSMGGKLVTGEGWSAADILERAVALQGELNPEPEDTGPDRVAQAMTLTEV